MELLFYISILEVEVFGNDGTWQIIIIINEEL